MSTFFDINELIQKGKAVVKEYELPVGKVFVRPLTDLEMNRADALAFDCISDPITKKYMISMTEVTKAEDLPDGVKMSEILGASAEVNAMICFLAMEDFTKDLTIEKVKQLPGLSGLAEFVKEISGAADGSKADVEEFRE
jgi:hypothetical protein